MAVSAAPDNTAGIIESAAASSEVAINGLEGVKAALS
jgi:hypothetical protein